MPAGELTALAARPDAYLATAFGVPGDRSGRAGSSSGSAPALLTRRHHDTKSND
ncbi:MAG TPA: hypothetical protein VE780_12975 [Thermoleophilaceae bacterium]|jgi:hypothetical protein|nr:hypothetical protein [Thermoleophilaceae bacterium]